MKINQSVFIQDLVIEERFTNCNANVITIKADLSIKMTNSKDYKKSNLDIYPWLIKKLIYLVYSMRSDIIFTIG